MVPFSVIITMVSSLSGMIPATVSPSSRAAAWESWGAPRRLHSVWSALSKSPGGRARASSFTTCPELVTTPKASWVRVRQVPMTPSPKRRTGPVSEILVARPSAPKMMRHGSSGTSRGTSLAETRAVPRFAARDWAGVALAGVLTALPSSSSSTVRRGVSIWAAAWRRSSRTTACKAA